MLRAGTFFAMVAWAALSLAPASAQPRERVPLADSAAAASDGPPRVFVDCREDCFLDYLRTDIPFVDYVRDRAACDLHVLVTTQSTGAGGREYTLALIGQGRFASMDETLRYNAPRDEPEERVRSGFAQVLKLGLMRYVLKTEMLPHIRISSDKAPPARKKDDRWNSWVFAVRGEGRIEGEEAQKERWGRLSLGADRITADWKVSVGLSASHEEEKFVVNDRDVVSTQVHRDFNGLAAKSLGRHWSVGAAGGAWRNTFENTRQALRLGPMLEYSVFPYEQSTRRQLRLAYRLEARDVRYEERTVFLKTEETLWREEVEVKLERREPWGSVEGELELSHYLHDLGKYRVRGEVEGSLRLVRGLSLNLFARASRVRDQLSLRGRGASVEEILLEQRELASGYEYEAWTGITFTFGSIYNNVVNPRFGD